VVEICLLENGGEYQTEWGGELEAVSHNPYSEGSGITYG
jgi:hypothetical protein